MADRGVARPARSAVPDPKVVAHPPSQHELAVRAEGDFSVIDPMLSGLRVVGAPADGLAALARVEDEQLASTAKDGDPSAVRAICQASRRGGKCGSPSLLAARPVPEPQLRPV